MGLQRRIGVEGGSSATAGRNQSCPCGSGRKYKQCCFAADQAAVAVFRGAEVDLRKAVALEKAGNIAQARDAYARVAANTPSYGEARSRLGHLLLAESHSSLAAAEFRAAAASLPASSARRMDLVRALLLEDRTDQAEEEVRAVIAEEPSCGDAHWVLGRLLVDSGRLEDGASALERAALLNPSRGTVFYDLARSRRITRADHGLMQAMQRAARSIVNKDELHVLHLALAKAHDDLGEPALAAAHLEKAHAVRRPMAVLDRSGLAARVDAIIQRFDGSTTKALEAHGDPSSRPIFILGMPRSGTTLVEQILSMHPDVVAGGELPFWQRRGGPELLAMSPTAMPDVAADLTKAYGAMLTEISPLARKITDKNPFNFFWAGLIHGLMPGATLLHCRRDPLDTCHSIRFTYFSVQSGFSTDPGDLAFYYRQYRRLMAHWRAMLPPERFVEVDYEALVTSPEEQTRRLVAACGLEWHSDCLRPEANRRSVKTTSKWQVRQPVYQSAISRARAYGPWMGELADLTDIAD